MARERNLAASAGGGIDWIRSVAAEFQGLKRATYDDVLNAPEHKVAEILDGELFLSPRPASRHSVASSRLGGALVPFDYGHDGPGGWWILDEPELHFGENVLVPDLGGWRRERMPAIPDTPFFSLAPDWVCEVLSPSTERIDRGRKLRIYAEAGVARAWLVNPVERTLEVLRLRDGAWTIVAVCSGSDVVRAEPFEAIELALQRLWLDSPASPDPLQPGPG
jgi:Uma2 family endonuclease